MTWIGVISIPLVRSSLFVIPIPSYFTYFSAGVVWKFIHLGGLVGSTSASESDSSVVPAFASTSGGVMKSLVVVLPVIVGVLSPVVWVSWVCVSFGFGGSFIIAFLVIRNMCAVFFSER